MTEHERHYALRNLVNTQKELIATLEKYPIMMMNVHRSNKMVVKKT